MIKAVVFDFFDVIHSDSQKAWLANHGLRREGIFAEASDMLDRGKINYQEYIDMYSKGSGIPAKKIVEEYDQLSALDYEMVEFVKNLPAHLKTGLLSNTVLEEIDPLLARHQLRPLFDQVCISSEMGIAKPDPEFYLHILGLLKVKPDQTIFVDDNPANIKAASELGFNTILHIDTAKTAKQVLDLIS